MERNKVKDLLLYVAGGALATVTIGGVYLLMKKISEPKLNNWLEQYFTEVEQMIQFSKGEPTPTTIGHIFQLITEVEEYFYLQKHQDLEDDRISALDSPHEYQELFVETMETRDEFYKKATDYVEKRLKVSISNLDDVLKKVDISEAKEALRTSKKSYPILPNVTKEKVREAFIHYVKEKKKNERTTQQEMYMMNANPEYRTTAMSKIFFIKSRLRDEIKGKFGFDEKFFDQLLEKFDLLTDSEVKYYKDELHNLN